MTAPAFPRGPRPAEDEGVLSPRTPILVRCADCYARFGEALGKPPRACPRCGSFVRVRL